MSGATPATPNEEADREPGPLRVVVSIPVLRWPIEDLTGEEDEIVTIVRSGQSAHGIELTPEDVKAIDRADILIRVGLGMDEEIARVARNRPSPHRSEVVLAEIADDAGQLGVYSEAEDDHDHDHGHDHDHDHGHGHGHEDPHIWLVPSIMSIFAEEIGAELEMAYSSLDRWDETTMLRVLQDAGNAADQASIAARTLNARMPRFEGRGIVTNHSAFNSFLTRYGLEEYATLQPHHGVEPTPGDIQRVVDAIRTHDLKGIIAVPGHDMSAARRVAQITGVEILEFDPLGDGDWPALMDEFYITLHRAMTGQHPADAYE